MYECDICFERRDHKDKVVLRCNHFLCNACFIEVDKRSNTCPFCRTEFVNRDDSDPEEWLELDPSEWEVYSRTDREHGIERIYVYRKDETPSWRNNEIVVKVKRNRQRKKRFKNKSN